MYILEYEGITFYIAVDNIAYMRLGKAGGFYKGQYDMTLYFIGDTEQSISLYSPDKTILASIAQDIYQHGAIMYNDRIGK